MRICFIAIFGAVKRWWSKEHNIARVNNKHRFGQLNELRKTTSKVNTFMKKDQSVQNEVSRHAICCILTIVPFDSRCRRGKKLFFYGTKCDAHTCTKWQVIFTVLFCFFSRLECFKIAFVLQHHFMQIRWNTIFIENESRVYRKKCHF